MDINTATGTDKINARILALVVAGTDPLTALRAVVGDDTVTAMIDRLYVELKGARSCR